MAAIAPVLDGVEEPFTHELDSIQQIEIRAIMHRDFPELNATLESIGTFHSLSELRRLLVSSGRVIG